MRHHELVSFREKPDRATAERFLQDGRFYWNSGMFCWTVSSILAELELHLPGHLQSLAPAAESYGTPEFPQNLERGFQDLTPISVDYAIMEKAQRRAAVVADFDWSDVGGWLALEPFLASQDGNAHRGRVADLDAQDNIVFCESDQELVSLVGVEKLVVVRSGNRTLVAHRDRLEEVKKLVGRLQPEDR
jgi:mannose-1-phosphate guanylyltransferase